MPYSDILDELDNKDRNFVERINKKTQGHKILWNMNDFSEPDWLRFVFPQTELTDIKSLELKEDYGPKIHLSIPRKNPDNLANINSSVAICEIIAEELIKAEIKLFKILPPSRWKSHGSKLGKEIVIYDLADKDKLAIVIQKIEERLTNNGYAIEGQPLREELKVPGLKIAYWRDDSTVFGYYADSRFISLYKLSPEVYANLNGRQPPFPRDANNNDSKNEVIINNGTNSDISHLIKSFNQQYESSNKDARIKRSVLLKEMLEVRANIIFRDLFIGMLPEESVDKAVSATLEDRLAWLFDKKRITETEYASFKQEILDLLEEVSATLAPIQLALEAQDNTLDLLKETLVGHKALKDECFDEVLFCGMRDLWNALAKKQCIINITNELQNSLVHQCLKVQPKGQPAKYQAGLTKDKVEILIAEQRKAPTEKIDHESEIKKRLAYILYNEAFWKLQAHSLSDEIPKTIKEMQQAFADYKGNNPRELISQLADRVPNDSQRNFFSRMTRSKSSKTFHKLINKLNTYFDGYYPIYESLDNFIKQQDHYLKLASATERIELGMVAKQTLKHR